MKKILLLGLTLFILPGCGHVSQNDLQREIQRSQEELRQELTSTMNTGDLASFECSTSYNYFSQAAILCERLNVYCNVVQVYENHCFRSEEVGTALPPRRGANEAVMQAIEDFNAAMTQQNSNPVVDELPDSPESTDLSE